MFAREVYQQAKGGKMKVIWSDPKHHLTSLKRAWETALERAGWILARRPESMENVASVQCQFDDLRHTAISRMIANKTPIPIIAILVSWSPTTTMWEMEQRYGHFDIDTLRENFEGVSARWISRSPAKSPVRRSFPGPRQFAKLS